MDKTLVGLLGVSLIIFIYILGSNFMIKSKKNDYNLGKEFNGYKRGHIGVEDFTNMYNYWSPLGYKISRNDGKKLHNCPHSNWRKTPSEAELKTLEIYSPQGSPFPLVAKSSKYGGNGTHVDDTDKTPKSMFTLAYNQCRPECCPSTYSCDGGCICTTKNQRNYIAKRGNNKTVPDNNEY